MISGSQYFARENASGGGGAASSGMLGCRMRGSWRNSTLGRGPDIQFLRKIYGWSTFRGGAGTKPSEPTPERTDGVRGGEKSATSGVKCELIVDVGREGDSSRLIFAEGAQLSWFADTLVDGESENNTL